MNLQSHNKIPLTDQTEAKNEEGKKLV